MEETSLETRLVAEGMVSAALLQLAINLAAQLVVASGGNVTTARAVAARGLDEFGTPNLPAVLPVPERLIEPDVAQRIAGTKIRHSVETMLEQGLLGAVKAGVKLSR